MAYTDFTFYSTSFFGDVLTVENADKWLSRASDAIDAPTFGRLITAFPTVVAHADKVRKAVCAVAEALYHIDAHRKAVALQREDDGTYRSGVVSSISSGGESISYASGNAATVYSIAAANSNEQNKMLNSIITQYLANVPDAEGTNLLYAGVM